MATESALRTTALAAGTRPSPPGRARRWRTQVWQRLVLFVLLRAGAGIRSLSKPASVRFGTALGSLAYRVASRQRRRAQANLHLAYGDELSPKERDGLTRRVFQHFGRGIVDFLRAPARSRDELARVVSCTGWEHVEAARARAHGVLLVSAHLGNWEVMGRWLATVKNLSLTVVAREPESAALAAYLRAMREGAGFKVLSKGASARGLLSALRRGETILILSDQNSGDVFAPFFGVSAGTPAGPATLALHSGAPLIPIYCLEAPDHTFQIICHPPVAAVIPPSTEGTPRAGRQDEVVRITASLNAVLEATVRQYPDQWLWLHNRWKSAFARENRVRAWSATGLTVRDFAVAITRWRG